MKTSVNTYSYGHYVNDLGIYGIIDKTKELGFDGIEFVEAGWMNVSDEELKKIGEYTRSIGLETVALCIGADFVNGSNGDVRAEIERVKNRVEKAALLGVKAMRHDVASQPRGRKYSLGYDDVLTRVADAVREVTIYAEKLGVITMSENHGYFSQDALRVEKLVNTVAHPNFGALVDIGNFMCADEEPWKSVGILAPYSKHVHCKDFLHKPGTEIDPGEGWFRTRAGDYLRGTVLGHGEVRAYQSIQTILRTGYDGFFSIEFEGVEDNIRGISLGLANLKRFAK